VIGKGDSRIGDFELKLKPQRPPETRREPRVAGLNSRGTNTTRTVLINTPTCVPVPLPPPSIGIRLPYLRFNCQTDFPIDNHNSTENAVKSHASA
jgi:hypothetical protein